MKRETIKTVAGLVVIAVIVVATFMYGNSQRQSQIKHEQSLKSQVAVGSTAPTPHTSTSPSSAPSPSSSPQSNTAPVKSPAANALQGGATTSPSPSVKPTPSPSQVAVATSPKTGGSADPLPQTGSSLPELGGVAAIIGAVVYVRYQKRAVVAAARSRR